MYVKDINAINIVSKVNDDKYKIITPKINLLAPGRQWKAFMMRYFLCSLMEKIFCWPKGQSFIFTWL